MLKNSANRYGKVAIILHWIIALAVIGEFGLGLYMTGTDYYHTYYQTMPLIHESVGITLLFVLIFRSIWGWINMRPLPGAGVGLWEQKASKSVKFLMNTLVLLIIVFGLMLSSSDGDSITVFHLFEFPAVIHNLPNQEDWSVYWHYWLSWAMMGLALMHTFGALKHHFFDRDETLRRMLGLPNVRP